MIQVQFDSVGPGLCGWCKKEKDTVYTVAFADKSFTGPMCKTDLLRAIEMKVPPRAPASDAMRIPKPDGAVAAK